MNSKIVDLARYTLKLLYDIEGHGGQSYIKLNDADNGLKNAISKLKDLSWDYLFAIKDDERQELTTHQQIVVECYAKLKRALLETYKEIFDVTKKF